MQAHTVLSTSSTGHGSLCRVGVPRHRQAFGAAPCRQQRRSATPIRAQGSVAPCEIIETQLTTVVHTGGTSKAQTNAQKGKAHPYIPMVPKELTSLEGACERCPNFELA